MKKKTLKEAGNISTSNIVTDKAVQLVGLFAETQK